MATPAMPGMGFDHDRFLVTRKLFVLLGKEFRFFDPNGRLIAYSKQKAFKLKEDIRIFADEAMSREILRIKARSIIDLGATYDVFESGTDRRIGSVKRAGLKSAMVRDEWFIRGTGDENLATITEDNWVLGLIRRNVINLIPQNYDIAYQGTWIGQAKQSWNLFFPKLDVNINQDPNKALDRRLLAAAIVLIMAIEGKQQ
jgi:hypothetical protein